MDNRGRVGHMMMQTTGKNQIACVTIDRGGYPATASQTFHCLVLNLFMTSSLNQLPQTLRLRLHRKRLGPSSLPLTCSMDPITVVGFVAAVVQLIDVTFKVVSYFNDVEGGAERTEQSLRERL